MQKILEEKIKKAEKLIRDSNNVPNEIRPIVMAICKGYIRESNGMIPIDGIVNVCNTTFNKVDEDDEKFTGKERILGSTETNYDQNCNVIHKMSYINDSNYIKLISILTHELGHVITEGKPCEIVNGVYPLVKRTTTIYYNCYYENNELVANNWVGFRMADGFLESISTKIFNTTEFREELYQYGYDLKDYVYKDERLFPSRIYDEYKACFEMFDYIYDGKLFEFSCKSFSSNSELIKEINQEKINTIFSYLDKSNDSLWNLKSYELKEADDKFNDLLEEYLKNKDMSLNLVYACLEIFNKSDKDEKFIELYNKYKNTLKKQKMLPIPNKYLEL